MEKKYQSFALPVFFDRGIHFWPMDFHHIKGE